LLIAQAHEAADEILPLTSRTRHFFAPHQVHGALNEQGVATLVYRKLIAAYARLDASDLARVFAACFLSSPAETLISGTHLVIAANYESQRLASSDTILADEIKELAGHQQLAISGCLRALSGRDDLVHHLLDSDLGRRWFQLCVHVNSTTARARANASPIPHLACSTHSLIALTSPASAAHAPSSAVAY
jgi:hypothetical protein